MNSDSETLYDIWFGGGGTNTKIGNKAGGDRVEDVKILIWTDQDRRDDGQHHRN